MSACAEMCTPHSNGGVIAVVWSLCLPLGANCCFFGCCSLPGSLISEATVPCSLLHCKTSDRNGNVRARIGWLCEGLSPYFISGVELLHDLSCCALVDLSGEDCWCAGVDCVGIMTE